MNAGDEYLARVNARYPGALLTTRGRITLTRTDPLLFSLVYLRHHLADPSTGGEITFGEQHLDWYEQMKGWIKPPSEARAWRHAYVAPRQSAKSTTWFLIAPLWAAAHGHAKFIAALGENADVATNHLGSFVSELRENQLLRKDFPALCTPKKAPNGRPVNDSKTMIEQENGFIFAAKGITSTSLGLKKGNLRPDVIILDDIEPPAESYSIFQMEQRLDTLQTAVLFLNTAARVVLVGTVTMDGSLIHQLVKSVTSTEAPAQWITEEKFKCHYYPALITSDDGTERSLWPGKWGVEELQGMRHMRSFMSQYQNLPMAADGLFWSPSDIVVADPGPDILARCRHLLSIDPATSTKTSSDATAIAFLSFDQMTGKVYVRQVWTLRLDPKSLRTKVERILSDHPEIRGILVETNQGGHYLREAFDGFPGVKYTEIHQSVKKEIRAGWLLNGYQKRQVIHVAPIPNLDAELLAFPRGLHDDAVDCVGSGYTALTGAGKPASAKFSVATG